MSQKTIYTCDRCGKETEDSSGWARVGSGTIAAAKGVKVELDSMDLCRKCCEDLVNFLETRKCGDKP